MNRNGPTSVNPPAKRCGHKIANSDAAPPLSQFSHLRASDSIGAIIVICCSAMTGIAIYLSTFAHLAVWLSGQLLLAFVMLQWFVLIHEAGHKTLFRSSALNKLSGHLSSLLAGIPFESWVAVHGMHHRWTGWQDLDATTATLVPRRLAMWERLSINVCWRLWIPLFSILYRLQNYWNLPRLYRLFPRAPKRLQISRNLVLLLMTYVTIVYFVGISTVSQVFGLSVIITLMMQDILILSQHSHIPMELSHGADVEPFAPAEQEFFTRSLRFPKWFSKLVLLNLDAHELHHIYPGVPGYYLNRIDYKPHNEVTWWRWIWNAKRVPGVVLLFQNSNDTGLNI
jgi:omega-6 fatty acid desaturase (delta-12 desaturase)